MMNKVLVTGGSGFIGRHLLQKLSQSGYQVCAISRRCCLINKIYVEAVDITDDASFNVWRQGKNFDVIVHLASDIPTQVFGSVAEKSFRKNVSAMLNIIKLSEELECPLIYTSSSSVYGSQMNSNIIVSEKILSKPDNFYSTSKLVGDILCHQLSHQQNIPCTVLRISAPYGPGNSRPTVINIFLKAALKSEDLTLYGTGKRMQDFTYIGDVVNAIYLALQKKTSGIFNIASGNSVMMKDLAEQILLTIPESKSKIVYNGKPDSQENYQPIFSIEKAKNILGWSPKATLSEGLQRTATSLKGEGISI